MAIAAASIGVAAATASFSGEHDDEHDVFSQSHSPLRVPSRRQQQHHHHHHRRDNDRRQLQQSAAEAFATFTPQKIKHATPLDLKIDDEYGTPFMSTLNGYMKPYAAESFAAAFTDAAASSSPTSRTGSSLTNGHGDFGVGDARYWDSIINLNSILGGSDIDGEKDSDSSSSSSSSSYSHLQSHHKVAAAVEDADDHLYYKILEVNGIDAKDKGLRRHLIDEDQRLEAHSSGASQFVASFLERSEDNENEQQHQSSSRLRPKGASRNKNKNDDDDHDHQDKNEKNDGNGKKGDNNDNDGGNKNSDRRKNKLPRIDRINPSHGDTIQDKQTFRARVQPSSATDVPVQAVYFQLTDSAGSKSDVLTVPRISDDLYEITVDGFSDYEGTEWSFCLIAEDERGRERKSEDISFQIAKGGNSAGGNSFANNNSDHSSTGEEENEEDGGGGGDRLMPKKKATDSSWSYKGAITGATGRILFEFDGSDETFVCSGTVIHDGAGGRVPDYDNGRSIIQTAAHCAYSDVMKKFANKAIFIPDQESTLGSESDFDCFNDKYGCWYLSFAVVADGWTRSSFPNNVEVRWTRHDDYLIQTFSRFTVSFTHASLSGPLNCTNAQYDYAYWVVYDDPSSTHSGGYAPGLTGQLDRDVQSMKIDFDTNIGEEFIFSIGYSADKDPKLRHCAMESSKINGVPWYDNLWLEDCTLTGGASGGPWMMDMQEDGVGTLISVNSWGFAYKPGMAGPNLSTSTGSWAECLYTEAKRARTPGSEGGYIMDNC